MIRIYKELSAAKVAEAKGYRALLNDPSFTSDINCRNSVELLASECDACAAEFDVRQRLETMRDELVLV